MQSANPHWPCISHVKEISWSKKKKRKTQPKKKNPKINKDHLLNTASGAKPKHPTKFQEYFTDFNEPYDLIENKCISEYTEHMASYMLEASKIFLSFRIIATKRHTEYNIWASHAVSNIYMQTART